MTELGDAILIIADKMGVTSTEVFRIVAEAQATIATINILSIILFTILACISIYIISKIKPIEGWRNDDMQALKFMIGMLYVLISAIFIIIIHDSIIMILCPEYTAIMEVFRSIGVMI